ncbi:porin [Phocaeicola sp.]|uniref:porin n=1 Tax=Phocaeicola sp. TaxID=2773926 RepID=UPI0023C38D09|nr:porin [Phocaeicola sp.]MDE5677271.1 OprO/OprP family phosphate-selective porin [Phocaeicola sp.]
MRCKWWGWLIAFWCPVWAFAESGIPIKLGGRLFVDGGLFTETDRSAYVKTGITEVRLTGKINLPDDWYTKIDVGFAGNKASLKDAFAQKIWGNNMFRAGYMLGMCSIEQSSSTNDFVFMTAANVAETFYLGRRVGITYTYAKDKYYISAGGFCGDGLGDDKVMPGYNMTLRGVFCPLNKEGERLHVGFGGLFRRPDKEKTQAYRSARFKSNGVTYLSVPSALDVEVDQVKHTFQWNVEAVYLSRRYFLQAEYLSMNVQREKVDRYQPWGAYMQGGFLIKGNFFSYDVWDALPLTPKEDRSLLLSGCVNVTSLNDGLVRGGLQQDVTVGLNYYMNKYVILKLNGSVVWTKEKEEMKRTFGVLQTRLQVRF